jgi:hypothetical protein
MWYWIKRVAEVTVDDADLSLRISQQSDKVQIKKLAAVGLDLIYSYFRDYIWTLNGGRHVNGR